MSEIFVAAKEKVVIGNELTISGKSPKGRFVSVFEDDGETGYFYALDNKNGSNKICDALHIYNVASVVEKDIVSDIEIIWSGDGLKSALLINNYPHAVFDFVSKRGYRRTNFPLPNEEWTEFNHEWTNTAFEPFQ